MRKVAEQLWIHEKFDDGNETWTCNKERIRFMKDETGGVKFMDDKEFLFVQYWAGDDHITETRPSPEQLEQLKNSKPVVARQSTDGKEDSVGAGGDDTGPMKAVKDIVDGQEMLRFEAFHTDALGQRHLTYQLWVDQKSQLPVRSRRWIKSTDAGVVSQRALDGTFDFPKTGPVDIYEIGVPRGLKIVQGNQLPPRQKLSPKLVEIFEGAKKAWARFPARFRLLNWPYVDDEAPSWNWQIERVYWNGNPQWADKPGIFSDFADWSDVRMHQETFWLGLDLKPNRDMKTAIQAETLLLGRKPHHFSTFDGVNSYSTAGSEKTLYIHRIRGKSPCGPNFRTDDWPRRYQWPFLEFVTYTEEGFLNTLGEFQILDPQPHPVPNTIALRVDAGRSDNHYDYYLDPARDYICLKCVRWNSGQHVNEESIFDLSELEQFSSGQWYATRRTRTLFSQEVDGRKRHLMKRAIDITLMEPDEFPVDVFNGEKIIQTSKEDGKKKKKKK
eukprot:TRINITY_DN2982_c0_g1_i7.p1 TRINITY_DN2982_c0_g1~~TRINITY_DN2982_c0_g1_i7.p1  ORF type:complete len:499 (-),score=20.45 TRINITY_DN2982_c0_g1_i7:52-1548(-)